MLKNTQLQLLIIIINGMFRLNVAHHDTMELKRQLLSIEDQMEMTKKHLHSLQDQKHKLTRGVREQECELSLIITGSLNHDSKEEDVS